MRFLRVGDNRPNPLGQETRERGQDKGPKLGGSNHQAEKRKEAKRGRWAGTRVPSSAGKITRRGGERKRNEGEGLGQGSQARWVKSPGGEATGSETRERGRDKGPKLGG